MSKKYFAKFLPIDGEIKEGDKYNWLNEIHTATALTIKMGHAKTRLKLFLCSRDIQVGEKWYLEDGDGVVGSNTRKEGEDWSPIMQEKAYKIIGEISPEANFVKEGDEFSDGEFCYRQFGNGRIYLERPEWFNYIAIKCPCCGDFK